MQNVNITNIFFSPNGTTFSIANTVSKLLTNNIESNSKTVDLLRNPLSDDTELASDTVAVISLPVYVGRIPEVARKSLEHIKGNKTPAIAIVVYGNREYDDALLELCDLLSENGFVVIGAAAFIAQHSIFPTVAAGRPDQDDIALIGEFAENCTKILSGDLTQYDSPISVKGNYPYRAAGRASVFPKANNDCNKCGICIKLCPVHAIDTHNPKKLDKELCIACGACIHNCPEHAKSFGGILYKAATKAFEEKCASYKTPEMFYIK